MNIRSFIKKLRQSDKCIKSIYLRGGCYQFYLLLKSLYPEAQPYIIEKYPWKEAEEKILWHVVAKYKGSYWDITGRVHPKGHRPMTSKDVKDAKSWSFSGNHNARVIACEHCSMLMIDYPTDYIISLA